MARKDKNENRPKRKRRMLLMRRMILPLALALSLIAVGCCGNGEENFKMKPSKEFIEGLESELDTVENCCPHTVEVIDDWIVQNAP